MYLKKNCVYLAMKDIIIFYSRRNIILKCIWKKNAQFIRYSDDGLVKRNRDNVFNKFVKLKVLDIIFLVNE